MPGRKTAKYSAAYNAEMKVALMDALLECKEAVNIDQLKLMSIKLTNMTNQKVARLMNELVEQGIAAKGKDKSNRVTYKAISNMVEQGYEIGPDRGYEYNDEGD
jgi:hypothetical protein